MKDYAAMSDFEINEAVGKFVYLPHLCVSNGVCLYAKDDIWTEFDPCNNPADAWPILLENNISLVKFNDSDTWEVWGDVNACYGEVGRSHVEPDENPLRAGMIVFLMMKEGE